MMQYNFIYFDVGGVIIGDFSKTNKWNDLKKSLGVPQPLFDEFDSLWSQYETAICTGRDVEELIPIINNELELEITVNLSLLDEFVTRFDKNDSIVTAIQAAKNCSNGIGLLTNMYTGMFAKIQQAALLPDFEFDQIVDSSVEGTLKPKADFFSIAAERAQCNPENILFIDNSEMHTNAAQELGWNVFLYDSGSYELSTKKLVSFLAR